jgi:hypothetical protein
MKRHFRLRKPLFFPLNYGDGNQRSAVRCQRSESESSRFYVSNSSFAKRCFALDRPRKMKLSIGWFLGNVSGCRPRLKMVASPRNRDAAREAHLLHEGGGPDLRGRVLQAVNVRHVHALSLFAASSATRAGWRSCARSARRRSNWRRSSSR